MADLSRSLIPEDDDGGLRDFDSSVAHPARIWDYLLGGKDNFAAGRGAGEQAVRAYPELVVNPPFFSLLYS